MPRRKKKTIPEGFRSNFEYEVAQELQPYGFSYEPGAIDYKIKRKYTPDFVFEGGNRTVLVECKGFFRSGDTQKYKAIRDCIDADSELVFILMKPNQRVSKNTKLTMSQWCDKEGLMWYTIDNLQELLDYVDA